MHKILITYYNEYKSVFDINFQIVLDNFDVEAIHKMRTSTKRLRSLFILIEFLSKKKFKAKKQLKNIRILFKFSGMIREIQIETKLVLAYQEKTSEIYPEYLEYLKQREHREIARFLKHLPKISKRKRILNDVKITKTINNLPVKDLKQLTNNYLRSKENSIKMLIEKPASNHRIHSNRTHLKQIYYLFDILSALSNNELILGLNYERLRVIEQYFGDWHDLVNSPVYMNAFFKTKKYKKEAKYESLKNTIAADRKIMRKEITKTFYPEIMA